MKKEVDVLIVGAGISGLFCALNLPREKNILMITKDDLDQSDSYLAQGGICMLRDEADYEEYYEDTMRAGHYKNRPESVEIMIRSSQDVIADLVDCGVEFTRQDEYFVFTKEGGHSSARILFHQDITGEEITRKLLKRVKQLSNVTIWEHQTMVDLICKNNHCYGIISRSSEQEINLIEAKQTVLACGGIGGLYEHSTNFSHLTGDGLAVAIKHQVALENPDYIQIHPTTLYSGKPGRRFLISESVRGEGAILYNAQHQRFVDELLPRDLLSNAIHKQMEQDKTPFVWLSMEHINEDEIRSHFPNIYKRCLDEGFDVTKECIPVVPAQHYFMGGIKVDKNSKTTMEQLYAVGETSCNGVHGANRLASNSLLESLVFAKRCAGDITRVQDDHKKCGAKINWETIELEQYRDNESLERQYRSLVQTEIERMRKVHEQSNYNEIECG